jgi:REP-associated tyrosine transposase
LVNSLKGVSSRRLRQHFRVRTHREHLWSPSYLAASAGGAALVTLKAYIHQQRTPGRSG